MTRTQATPTFEMTVDLNVLEHLGINLYSNIAAVLTEAVANAWDADASSVQIRVDPNSEWIEIEDDGVGMSVDDLNGKYLYGWGGLGGQPGQFIQGEALESLRSEITTALRSQLRFTAQLLMVPAGTIKVTDKGKSPLVERDY